MSIQPPPLEGQMKFGTKEGRMRETTEETGDRMRTFPVEAAVATHQQKPRALATPKCWSAEPPPPPPLTVVPRPFIRAGVPNTWQMAIRRPPLPSTTTTPPISAGKRRFYPPSPNSQAKLAHLK